MNSSFHILCRKFFSDNIYGGSLIILSTLSSATTSGITHGLSQDLPPMEILFFKCLSGLLILALVYRKQFLGLMRTAILPIHAAKGACGALGNWAWISALQHLPLAESSALSITSAFFTSLGGMLLFKEKFHLKAWVAIIVGFMGVLLILHPSRAIFSFYAFLPLVSALFFSGSSLIVKSLSREDASQTILIYLLSFMGIFAALSCVHTPWILPMPIELAKLAIVGASYVLTQVCLIEAYTYAHTSFLAPFKYARFPLNILTGLLFFAEIPPATTFLGGMTILLSYAWLIRVEYRKRVKG